MICGSLNDRVSVDIMNLSTQAELANDLRMIL